MCARRHLLHRRCRLPQPRRSQATERNRHCGLHPRQWLRGKRASCYAEQYQHLSKPDPLRDKTTKPKPRARAFRLNTLTDFRFDSEQKTYVCRAGQSLYGNGSHCLINGQRAIKFQGAMRDCLACLQRAKFLRTPQEIAARQVAFFLPKVQRAHDVLEQTRQRIDSQPRCEMIRRRWNRCSTTSTTTSVWTTSRCGAGSAWTGNGRSIG